MFKLITQIISLIAIIAALFSPVLGWVILAVPASALLITLVSFKMQKWQTIPELSAEGNILFKKYGHFFRWTFLARECGHCASVVDIAGIVIGVIGLFHSFWWGIAFALADLYLMTLAARQFDPTFGLELGLQNRHTVEEVMSFAQHAKYGDIDKEEENL